MLRFGMFKLAYLAGQNAALRQLGLLKVAEEWVRTGPAPAPGALPPVNNPGWTTASRGGQWPQAAAQAAEGAAEAAPSGFMGRLVNGAKKRPLVAAGMALGAGTGLAMMNPAEPQMRVAPSAPIQQYFA